jgi:ribosomal protein S6
LKTYQALFIFSTSLTDEAVNEIVQWVRGEVEKLKGTVRDTQLLGKRTFARPLKKMDTGNFVKLLAELPPAAVATLLARMKLNDKIYRVQIVELPRRKKVDKAPAKDAAAPAPSGGAGNG